MEPSVEPRLVATREGYDLWASIYDDEDNPLIAVETARRLLGIQARFTDPVTGRKTLVAGAPHQISDYVTAATGAGLHIDHMSEHLVDEEVAARSPRAEKYLGWPLLLLLRLRVNGSRDG